MLPLTSSYRLLWLTSSEIVGTEVLSAALGSSETPLELCLSTKTIDFFFLSPLYETHPFLTSSSFNMPKLVSQTMINRQNDGTHVIIIHHLHWNRVDVVKTEGVQQEGKQEAAAMFSFYRPRLTMEEHSERKSRWINSITAFSNAGRSHAGWQWRNKGCS